MTTQYVMKATHINSAPFTTIYWTVSGAPDNTGAQSGYSMSDLINISVDYTTTVSASAVSGGTTLLVPTRYTPVDSNTIINWKLDEGLAPYTNSGTGAATTLSAIHGTETNITGVFNQGVGLFNATLSSGATTVNEVFTTALTISAWTKLSGSAWGSGGYAPLVAKLSSTSNATSPTFSLYLTSSGTFGASVLTSGISHGGSFDSIPYVALVGVWVHVAFTYNGSNILLYVNGELAQTTPCTGNIDYGSHGAWVVGGFDADISGFNINAYVDDVRIENVVRSQTYLEAMYKNGIGQYDGTFGNPNLAILSDGYANLPTAGAVGRLFIPTDRTFSLYRDNGTSWTKNTPNNFPNDLFTAPPPSAIHWSPQFVVAAPLPEDVPGGVKFTRNILQGASLWTKPLNSPGGAHVVTMFIRQQTLPAYNTVDSTYMMIALVGALNGGSASSGNTDFVMVGAYESAGQQISQLIQRRDIATYGANDFANINFPWTLDTSPQPFGDAWWKITFDNTNVTVLRAIPGGIYYLYASFAHSCGPIQQIGLSLYGHLGNVSATILDYVET